MKTQEAGHGGADTDRGAAWLENIGTTIKQHCDDLAAMTREASQTDGDWARGMLLFVSFAETSSEVEDLARQVRKAVIRLATKLIGFGEEEL